MNFPNLYIIFGTLLIAIGGLLATHGWNSRSDLAKKNSILKAITAEYLTYESVILDKKVIETNEEELSKFVIYPRFQTIALESVISSGLFLESDKELYTRAVNLHELLNELNSRWTFSEKAMSDNTNLIKTYREKIRDGKTRKSVIVKLQKFGDLLENKYGLDFTENYFVSLDED